MKLAFRSLSFKLIVAFLAVSLTGTALAALFFSQQTAREFNQFVFDRAQADLVDNLAQYYQTTGSWAGLPGNLPLDFVRRGQGDNFRAGPPPLPVTLVDEEGRVIAGGRGRPRGSQLSPEELGYTVPVAVDGVVVGRVLVPDNAFQERGRNLETQFLTRVNLALLFGAVGATGVALLLAVLLAQRLTRPLGELTAATRALAGGELEQRVAVRSQDELGELALAFNQMSADLARASRLRRQMTADIAHDLRTPLSIILGYTESMRDGKLAPDEETLAIIHDEAQHLNRLVEDLRTLSLADAGELRLDREPVAPRALLQRTAAAHRARVAEKGVSLAVAAPDDLPAVDIDPDRMAQVLGNLVANSLRHTAAGGQITLGAGQANGRVWLQVRDTGTGIDPEELPHIFDRFYRGDAARPLHEGESGLGLAIARSIVALHGGAITAASRPGEGTVVTIELLTKI